ncbi:Papain family cysteine protease [compost metagenome]
MSKLRSLTLGALTLVTLATAAGCGQTANVPSVASLAQADKQTATVTINGVSRKLGYDWTRYQSKLAKKAKPQRLRQSLRPAKMDLRTQQAPVYDQGQLGSCTAFAMTKGLREFMQRKNGERVVPLSALFGYYETRARLGSINQDSGGTITDGMEVLKDVGAATDETLPYDIAKFKIKPSAEAYKSASEFKVKSITQLAGLDDVKASLAQNKPVAFGFLVYKSMMKTGADGKMPMPAANEKVLGGHAVLAVGYDDTAKSLIIRNSWGEKFGDKGYFYMPYEFVTEENTADFWTAE